LVGFDTGLVEPSVDLVDVEAKEPSPLVEWDAPLAHEASDVAYRDSEVTRECVDVDQPA
jgi:hypothetical protein